MSFDKKALGLAGGVLWGPAMLLATIASITMGYGSSFLQEMMSVYPGYSLTWIGSVIGLVYGFLDGFIGLYIFAWLYNLFEEKV